jgi:hypothetical protein
MGFVGCLDKVLGERTINQAAQDFEQRLFKIGGLGTVEAVVKKVLNRALMHQVHNPNLKMRVFQAWW